MIYDENEIAEVIASRDNTEEDNERIVGIIRQLQSAANGLADRLVAKDAELRLLKSGNWQAVKAVRPEVGQIVWLKVGHLDPFLAEILSEDSYIGVGYECSNYFREESFWAPCEPPAEGAA